MQLKVNRIQNAAAPVLPGRFAHLRGQGDSPTVVDVFVGPRLGFVEVIGRAVLIVRIWRQRANQRHRLMTLDDRMLADVGLSRTDAVKEYGKPFWK